ncbi:MAG: hypothetical protein QW815_04790, partial [Nitrososphaerota archaeon]
ENHLSSREALAELMAYIDFRRGITKIRDYVGLYKVDRSGKRKIYSGDLRRALQRLTIALKGGTWMKAKDEVQLIRRIREIMLTRTS